VNFLFRFKKGHGTRKKASNENGRKEAKRSRKQITNQKVFNKVETQVNKVTSGKSITREQVRIAKREAAYV